MVPLSGGSCTPSGSGPFSVDLQTNDPDTLINEGLRRLRFRVTLNPGADIPYDLVVTDEEGAIVGAVGAAVASRDIPGGGEGS